MPPSAKFRWLRFFFRFALALAILYQAIDLVVRFYDLHTVRELARERPHRTLELLRNTDLEPATTGATVPYDGWSITIPNTTAEPAVESRAEYSKRFPFADSSTLQCFNAKFDPANNPLETQQAVSYLGARDTSPLEVNRALLFADPSATSFFYSHARNWAVLGAMPSIALAKATVLHAIDAHALRGYEGMEELKGRPPAVGILLFDQHNHSLQCIYSFGSVAPTQERINTILASIHPPT